MSRFYEGDGEGRFPNEWELWEANYMRALGGRKGQAALRDLEAALLDLPEPKLISSRLSLNGQVCTMGALAVYRRCNKGEDRAAVLAELEQIITSEDDAEEYGAVKTANLGVSVGVTYTLAYGLAMLNDELPDYSHTPEERYNVVLRWVRGHIHPEMEAASV